MDKKKKWLKITLGIMALVIVGVYIGGIAAFHGKFLKNTDIGGVYRRDCRLSWKILEEHGH